MSPLSPTGREWMQRAARVGISSMAELARQCGIKYLTLRNNCKGLHKPSVETAEKFELGMRKLEEQREEGDGR